MTIIACEGFDMYSGPGASPAFGPGKLAKLEKKASFGRSYRLEDKRPWWKKILFRRPSGRLYVNFFFGPEKDGQVVQWECAESVVRYPPGTHEVTLKIETRLNGQAIQFDPNNICIADMPD